MDKDRKKAAKVAPFVRALNELVKELDASASSEKRDDLESLVWMIEEYKVSLFAQELKTAFPISSKKIEDKIREIQRMV
jgi:ATP-dependent helicase HrpA